MSSGDDTYDINLTFHSDLDLGLRILNDIRDTPSNGMHLELETGTRNPCTDNGRTARSRDTLQSSPFQCQKISFRRQDHELTIG